LKISIRRAVAASAAAALAATGAAMIAPSATATEQSAKESTVVLTPFGYNTVASGAKVMLQGVDVRTARLAMVSQACTREVGLSKSAQLVPTTPVSDYVDIKGISSTSKTYKSGTKYGAIATNTIGDIAIGNAAEGLGLISLKGLTTTADAFHTPNGYGSKPGLKFAQIGLQLPDALEDIPVPVQDLVDAVNGVLNEAQPVVDQVIGVLQQYGTIEIPGFGKIALGETWKQKGAHFASADAHGLVIQFTGDGSNSVIYLGQAHSRVGGVAPKRVFRSNIQAMDMKVLDGALHLSRVGATNLPCEGTFGATRHKKVSVAGIVAPVVVNLSDIDNSYNGIQNKDKAVGWAQSSIGQVDIPLADLTLKGIVSRVKVSKFGGHRVTSAVKTTLGELIIGGESVAVPAPGEVLELPNGIGTIETGVIRKGQFGAQAQAVRVTLFEQNVEILFGWVDNNVWSK